VNINKLKPYQYLNKTPKGLKATIKGEGEHKEDLQEDFQDDFTKIQFTPKKSLIKNHIFGNDQPK
jgi:hypothetical protein